MGLGASLLASLSRCQGRENVGVHQPDLIEPQSWQGQAREQEGESAFYPLGSRPDLLMLGGHSAPSPGTHLGVVNILRCTARGSMWRL